MTNATTRDVPAPDVYDWAAARVHLFVGVLVIAIVTVVGLIAKASGFFTSFEMLIVKSLNKIDKHPVTTFSLLVEHAAGPTGAILTTVIIGILIVFIRHNIIDGGMVVVLTGATWATSWFVKEIVGRPRPDAKSLIDLGAKAQSSGSFPSGHVVYVVALLLAIGVLFRLFTNHRWYLLVVFVVAGVVGFTRVYLGVHYPLDVLCSIAYAAGGLAVYNAILRKLRPWITTLSSRTPLRRWV